LAVVVQRDVHPAAAGLDPCAQIATDSAALADAAAGNFSAAVEHCPGWTVADLVYHTYEVQYFWRRIVGERAHPDQVDYPVRPADAALIDVFRAGAEQLVAVLGAADPATPVWTWAPQQDAGFVIRHQVQEAAVHRWDAENATGAAAAIERSAAIDSIEEFLTFSTNGDAAPLRASVALEATDADAAWTVEDAPDGLSWRRGDGAFESRVRGTASDLLLWLYGRAPSRELVSGDAAVLDRLRAHLSTD
jgi:uncharacterized protein (TIGR03083 family)